MRRIVAVKKVFLLLIISLTLTVHIAAGQEDEERRKLLQQEKSLQDRIGALRKEQDFLLFQKALYETDSKYLIINLSEKTGQLKYKNRVLRDFHFSAGNAGRLPRGRVSLSKKIETGREPKRLVFGNTFLLLPKRSSSPEPRVPALILGTRDFKALFYALEEAAPAYLLR